jgi:type IV secretion system protein VirD4
MNAAPPKHRLYLGYENWDGNAGSRIGYPGDGHMLTIGPTRSGKSRRLLIPNLLHETARSALVVDMKGELAALTATHRASKGGRVVALDPFGILAKRGVKVPTVGFNPMLGLDPQSDDFVDDAMVIAEALVQVSPTAKDPHWAESAQDVVAALIMWVKTVRGDKAELNAVRQMVGQPPKALKVIALAAERANANPAIGRKLAKFLEGGKESTEMASVLSTAQTQTRFLDSPGIVRNLAQGGVSFEELKTSNLTVFLVLPPQRLVSHAKWLRLIISSAMQAMQKDLDTGDRPPVLFLLDEFPQLGRLPAVETAVSLNAGFGVKVWAAVQHLGQLKEHYGDNWETFLSAGCVTAFAPRDVFTRDHLTKLIGTGTKAMRSVSHGSTGGPSYTDSVQKDDLMAPHQWREMVIGEHFAFIPTDKGQLIKRLYAPDFTALPEVVAGQIRV